MNWGGKYDLPGGDSAPAYSLPADDAGSLVTEPIATFGHPIGMSFDVKEQNFESGLAPSAAYPVILIEVFSTQYLGGNTLEGYGYVSLRDMVGCQDFTVATWRPVGSRHSRLMEFFVGGNPVLQHPVFAEVPNKMSSSLSRFGVLSEGSGSVRFRVHSTKTDPRKKGLLNEKLKRGQPDAPSKTLGRRSVDEIVNHFKQVEALNRSMTKSGVLTKSAMNALGKSADLSASIRSADGESLSSAARTEKVQQILNRAKNRVATLTKDDSEVAQAKSRPQESLGAKRLGLPRSTEEEKDEEGERSPLLGKPPIRKIPMRMQSAEPEESSGLRLRQRMKDETEQWDSYETPIRTRRSSPALEASPLAEDNLDNIRDKMAGFQTPDAEEEDQDASESDPLIDAPRTLSGTARMRQFQREKSLSGEVTEQLTGPELKPLRPTLGKFSNPKRGPNSNA